MSAKPITMLQLRRILQLLNKGNTERSISREVSVSRNTVSDYKQRAIASLLSYSALAELNDESLSKILFEPEQNKTLQKDRYLDLQNYIKEFEKEPERFKKILTKKLLWSEYKEKFSEGYEYSRFCDYLFTNEKVRNTAMHFFHKPGEKLMVDFTGKPFIFETQEGETKKYQVFVAVFSYSGYTYVQAVETQNQFDFLNCMEHMLKFYGGAPEMIISDNLKSCVTKYDRYDPELTELMDQFCLHYQVGIIPARPFKPKDKPMVERHVRLVYERIFAPLRGKIFSGLRDVNEAFDILNAKHNSEKFRLGDKTRIELFEQFEKNLLKPLPFVMLDVSKRVHAKVSKCHDVWLGEDKHYYSAPYEYTGKEATLVYNSTTVEIYVDLKRVAVHRRNRHPGGYTSIEAHMPTAHVEYEKHRGWTSEYFHHWAQSISLDTFFLIEKMLCTNIIKQQSFKSCFGTLRLEKKYGKERFINACTLSLNAGVYRFKFISNILKNNMDLKKTATPIATQTIMTFHENNRNPSEFV